MGLIAVTINIHYNFVTSKILLVTFNDLHLENLDTEFILELYVVYTLLNLQ